MKVLTENINDYIYFHYILNVLSHIGNNINVLQDIQNLNKSLVEIKPELILLKTENITKEVLVYADQNKAKLIVFGNDTPKKYDILITKDQTLTNGENIILDKILANPLQVANAEYKKSLSSEISILTNDATDPVLVETLAINYPVKIYGNKRINSPKYLGKINQEQRNNILKSSKYIIDFGTYDYLDSIILDTYPVLYTNNEVPEGLVSFNSLTSMIEIIDKLLNNEIPVKDNMVKLKETIKNNNIFSLLKFILDKLGFKKEAKKLGEIE